jgi:hypothetical protein
MTGRRLRIGEAAARADVSVRTLRHYEELGLLTPSAHSPGGAAATPRRSWPAWPASASSRTCSGSTSTRSGPC